MKEQIQQQGKSRNEWFEMLEEPDKSMAHKNYQNYRKVNNHIGDYDEMFDSIVDALVGSFFWAGTTEGHDYWKNIARKFEHNFGMNRMTQRVMSSPLRDWYEKPKDNEERYIITFRSGKKENGET